MTTATNASPNPAHVIAVGAQTAVGRSAAASAAAVRAAVANFTAHPFLTDRAGAPMITARAPWLPADLPVPERLLALGQDAAAEALRPAAEWLRRNGVRLELYVGFPASRPGFDQDAVPRILAGLATGEALAGLRLERQAIIAGHAAGLMALETAWRRIVQGQAEACLVGGVDSYEHPDTLVWLERCRQLHSSENSWGFIPGEAAAFCLLVSDAIVARQALTPLVSALSSATARETNLIKTNTICTGAGLTQAYRQALAPFPAEPFVDHLICDLNGETYRANEFGFTLVRTGQRFRNPAIFRAPADCWGDVGAASGTLFLSLPSMAPQRDPARGGYTLLSTSSESGERCVAVIQSPVRRGSR